MAFRHVKVESGADLDMPRTCDRWSGRQICHPLGFHHFECEVLEVPAFSVGVVKGKRPPRGKSFPSKAAKLDAYSSFGVAKKS